jgi:hypothetical protein
MRRLAWLAVFGWWGCSAQMVLPRRTVEVKFQQGQLLTVEASEFSSKVKVWGRDGSLRRVIEAGAGLRGLRRVELKDFALAGDGTLVTSIGAIFGMGVASRLLGMYPLKGEPSFVAMDDVVCMELAMEARTGAWCLGPGLEDTLLHRVSGPAAGRWSLVPRKQVRLMANPGGETRPAYETGRAGAPQVMAGTDGGLLVWLPNAGLVMELSAIDGEARNWNVPLAMTGRSVISFAASQGGAVYGLMPLRGPSDPELLTTRYGVVRLERRSGEWVRLPELGSYPRGSTLAGVDGERPVVWNRRTNVVSVLDVRPE